MDEKVCEARHSRVTERINRNEKRIDKHGERLDIIEQDIIATKKDTVHLQEAIKDLKKSIDLLIVELSSLKSKPLEKYEKVAMAAITTVVGYLVGKLLK